ncbi:MAG: IPT/TIG domain-containing protein [Anaeromyxobacteraceae bacterium]
MTGRSFAAGATLALAAFLTACSGGGAGDGGAAPTGSLAVAVAGLPGGAAADVSVSGPSAFSRTIGSSETLTGLAPGSYTVAAGDVASAGFSYAALITGSPAAVTDGGTAAVTVAYAATTGRLTVTVSGLPAGAAGDVTVTGPADFSQHLTATTTLTGLAPGSYAVAAATVPSAGKTYAAVIGGSPANVTAGSTAAATAAYAEVVANGQLTVNVTGGINLVESRAHVTVSGPGGYAATLTTSPQTFSGLAPGTYTVDATAFTSASGTFPVAFTPQVNGSPATVAGGGNPQVSVAFVPPVPSVAAVSPKKADLTVAGVNVTVTGTDFVPGATVTFGGVAGVVQSVLGRTTLTVKAPAVPPGVVDVQVTTPGGTSPTLAANRIGSYHFTAYAVPTGGGQGGMALGPDGNLWFTERARGKVGRVTPAGVVTEFSVPDGSVNGNAVTGDPVDIAAGADGNLWFSDWALARVGYVTPAGAVTMVPLASGCTTFGITHGPGTTVWFNEDHCPAGGQNHVGSVDTANVAAQQSFPVTGSFPLLFGITLGADGNLWSAEYNRRKLRRTTPAGVFTELPEPSPPPPATDTALTFSNPLWLVTGSDGNVWFNDGKLGVITPTGTLTDRDALGTPGGLVVGRINRDTKGRVWYSGSNVVGWMDTATFENDTYPVSTFGTPSGIAATDDGVIWVLVQGAAGASVLKLEH